MWCYLLTEHRLLNILLIIFLCTVKLLKIQASLNQKKKKKKSSSDWAVPINIADLEKTVHHMNARAHTYSHTHTLVNVKVNGPAIGPDSTALYHHRTGNNIKTWRSPRGADDHSCRLQHVLTRFITGHKTAAVSVEEFVRLSQHQSVMAKQVFLFDCSQSAHQNLTERHQKFPMFHE